jgi:O-antigen ligase
MNKQPANKLCFFLFPLLFIPDLGYGIVTNYGLLEIGDFLAIAFLGLVAVQSFGSKSAKKWLLFHQVLAILVIFVWWAILVILLIPLRYDYFGNSQLWFSLLKLAKFVLFVAVGLSLVRYLQNEDSRRFFHWSLLGVGWLISLTLIWSNQESFALWTYAELFERVYIDNLISVTLAMLICYVGGVVVAGYGSVLFQRFGIISICLMMVGIFFTSGRGGWIALVLGVLYIIFRHQSRRVFGFAVLAVGVIFYAYNFIPSFEYNVNRTLWPNEAQLQHLERYNAGLAGYDDGKRTTIWLNEGRKFLQNPMLGTGFFHRGGRTGLHSAGSHNLFIQMFLETGIVGGLLIISLFFLLWKQAGFYAPRSESAYFEVPFKACVIAAVAGALGGEYFYGGQALLLLFSIYAVIGSFEIAADGSAIFPFRRRTVTVTSGMSYGSSLISLKKAAELGKR